MRTVIIGAGLTGLSAAYHLKKDWVILEKENSVGGLARSSSTEGFIFDKTGHLLHLHNPYVTNLITRKLLGGKLLNCRRNSWIFSKETFTRYPFQANTYGLPEKILKECVISFLEARDKNENPPARADFKHWCLATFGQGISKHFMIPYNKKLWLIDLKKMTTEWIRNFVPRPNREEVLYGALTDQKKFFGYNAFFYYPKEGGIQTLADAISRSLNDAELYLNCEAVHINIKKKELITSRQERFSYDWLINTGPLDVFLDRIVDPPSRGLDLARKKAFRFTEVYNLNLGLSCPGPIDKHWTYFPERKFHFYRIGVSSNFAPGLAPKGTSSFYVEFARRPNQSFDFKKMLAHTLASLHYFGWMKPKDEVILARWSKISPAYVVYTKERQRFLPETLEFLERHNIISTGRYGAWKYSFMEEAILDGKAAAEKILAAS